MPSDAKPRCPICGAEGVDLVFNFECSNPLCQNHSASDVDPFAPDELRTLLECMWELCGEGESLDEFIARFYAEGGKVEQNPDHPGIEHAVIVEPEWLRQRMVFNL